MPRRTTTLTLTLPPRARDVSTHRWLCGAIRDAILERRLQPGTRLPATRDLARQYGVARGTVVTAFDQLGSEGYIRGRKGSGTYVNEILPDDLLQVGRRAERRAPAGRPEPRRLSGLARRARPFPLLPYEPVRAFRTNQPALDLFPTATWAQVAARRLRRATSPLLLGGSPTGYRPLQEAIASYLMTSRGVRCVPDQVLVVSGSQEALDLVCRIVLDPGDRVCMEDPGYIGATLAFEACGARICPLPVDGEGMQLPHGRSRAARLAHVTPAHQFPTGVSMSLPRRLALLGWARAAGALIFEDDYDSEYRYAGRPIPALQGLDAHGVVLFAGTFSKVLFASLRLGYLVVPADLVDRFAAVRSLTTRHAPLLDQAVLCDFMVGGHFARHVRRMREVYAERLAVLLEAARRRLAGLMDVSAIEAGLQTTGWLYGGMTSAAAVSAAAAAGVEIGGLHRFWQGPATREGVLLGFAAVDAGEIRRGVALLAKALSSFIGSRGTASPP